MITKILLPLFILCSACFSESTNLVGISKGWFLLADKQAVGRYTNEVNDLEESRPSKNKLVMSTSGKTVSGSYFLNLQDIGPRLYLLSHQYNTNKTFVVIAMPPFPQIERANYSSLDSYIFELKNVVALKARPIRKEIFDQLVNNLYVWKIDNVAIQEPFPISDENTIKSIKGEVNYFLLEDVYNFGTRHPEKRRRDWLFPFRYFEQKIILKSNDSKISSKTKKHP